MNGRMDEQSYLLRRRRFTSKKLFNCFKTKPQIPFLGEASSNKRESFGSSVQDKETKLDIEIFFIINRF